MTARQLSENVEVAAPSNEHAGDIGDTGDTGGLSDAELRVWHLGFYPDEDLVQLLDGTANRRDKKD